MVALQKCQYFPCIMQRKLTTSCCEELAIGMGWEHATALGLDSFKQAQRSRDGGRDISSCCCLATVKSVGLPVHGCTRTIVGDQTTVVASLESWDPGRREHSSAALAIRGSYQT